jgi:hypothetical protein
MEQCLHWQNEGRVRLCLSGHKTQGSKPSTLDDRVLAAMLYFLVDCHEYLFCSYQLSKERKKIFFSDKNRAKCVSQTVY